MRIDIYTHISYANIMKYYYILRIKHVEQKNHNRMLFNQNSRKNNDVI